MKVSGSFSTNAKAGTTTLRLTGRVGGRKLKPGRYRLTAKATDAAGNAAKAQTATFRIKR